MRRCASASRFRSAFTCGRLRGLRSMIGTCPSFWLKARISGAS